MHEESSGYPVAHHEYLLKIFLGHFKKITLIQKICSVIEVNNFSTKLLKIHIFKQVLQKQAIIL